MSHTQYLCLNAEEHSENYMRNGHGLRKNFLEMAAEAGGTNAEMKSWSGHTSNEMIDHYIKRADKKRLANAMKAKVLKSAK